MAYRIEICAPMGVGKTTAARALALHGYRAVEENPAANPHLAEFYATFSPESAYKKDMWFADHVRSCIASGHTDNIVMDFSLVLCRAYVDAGINTAGNAATLQGVFDLIARELGQPDLLIVIDLPLDVQMQRIQARTRAGEDGVPADYLRTLAIATSARVAQAARDGLKILLIDGTQHDFRDPAQAKVLADMVQAALRVQTSAPARSFKR